MDVSVLVRYLCLIDFFYLVLYAGANPVFPGLICPIRKNIVLEGRFSKSFSKI
tara:strand:- start:1286 stop:1444 length:159 start_codon:yes stop_codon:yes gene_type:complete